ncbi:MAG: thiamine pyrophosphate-dependent enzyme, partial [Arenicellales bacterium WSBS_2016_MAG_OTU3]
QFACERPRSWLHPVGYGTLGFALPAAIGGKLAAPNRPAVALTGDGGFMFTVQELATAVELELPLAIVLWDNNAYGQIRDDMQASNIDLVGVRPQNPRFETLAQAFGCAFKRPQSAQDFVQALNASHSVKKPTLIQIQDDAAWL